MKKIVLLVSFLSFFAQTLQAKTAGTVNGIKISVNEANKALKKFSKDKSMTWNKLPDEGKIQLIQMLAPSKVVEKIALKSLSKKEKETGLASFWMQKEISKMKISDKEAKKHYRKMRKMLKKLKSKQKLPSFKVVKNSLKMQIAQEKVVKKLLKKAKIRLK